MTQIRKHIVDDMTKHISGELIRRFKRHVEQLEAGGVSSAEGALIAAKVGRDLLVATVGGAALLTGSDDLNKVFSGLTAGVIMEIMANRPSIMADLQNVAAAHRP